jgi:hypothetical protein
MATEYIHITPADKASILEFIAKIKVTLPKAAPIERKDIRRVPRLINSRYSFVNQALYYAKNYPELKPPYSDIDEAMAYFKLRTDLDEISVALYELETLIDDTRTIAGSKSYMVGLNVYDLAKRGAKKGVAIMVSACEQLKGYFEHGAVDKNKPDSSKKSNKSASNKNDKEQPNDTTQHD